MSLRLSHFCFCLSLEGGLLAFASLWIVGGLTGLAVAIYCLKVNSAVLAVIVIGIYLILISGVIR
jgi:hypothetical protein